MGRNIGQLLVMQNDCLIIRGANTSGWRIRCTHYLPTRIISEEAAAPLIPPTHLCWCTRQFAKGGGVAKTKDEPEQRFAHSSSADDGSDLSLSLCLPRLRWNDHSSKLIKIQHKLINPDNKPRCLLQCRLRRRRVVLFFCWRNWWATCLWSMTVFILWYNRGWWYWNLKR